MSLEQLELIFALPDHKTRYSNQCLDQRPIIMNFRPDYFSPDKYSRLIDKDELVETGLGTYHKKNDFTTTSRRLAEVIDSLDFNLIPRSIVRVVIYEKK